MNKKITSLIKIIVSVLLIFYLVNNIGLSNILNTITKVNLFYLPLIILIWVVTFLIGAMNIKLILFALNEKLAFKKTLKYYIKAWSYGMFLPGRVGEFSLIYYLKKEDIILSKGLITSLLDKVMSFTVLFSIALFGLFKLLKTKEFLIILIMCLGALLIGLFLLSTKGRYLVKRFVLRKYANHFKGFHKNLIYLLKNKKKILIVNLCFSMIKWILIFITIHLWFKCLGISVNFYLIMGAVSVGLILSIIPITIGGLGIRENSSLAVFTFYGVNDVVAGSVLLLQTVLKYIIAIIVINI